MSQNNFPELDHDFFTFITQNLFDNLVTSTTQLAHNFITFITKRWFIALLPL